MLYDSTANMMKPLLVGIIMKKYPSYIGVGVLIFQQTIHKPNSKIFPRKNLINIDKENTKPTRIMLVIDGSFLSTL